MATCKLCDLECNDDEMNFHHLIPKTFHNNKRISKLYEREFLNKNGVMLCIACHNKLHSCIEEKDMDFEFNTIEKIKTITDIQKWISWKQKHPEFKSTYNRMSNIKRHK